MGCLFDQPHEHAGPCPHHGDAHDLDHRPAPIHHARILHWGTAPCQFDHTHDHIAKAGAEQHERGHSGDSQRDQRVFEPLRKPQLIPSSVGTRPDLTHQHGEPQHACGKQQHQHAGMQRDQVDGQAAIGFEVQWHCD